MKSGDLVTPTKNHASAYRLWDSYEHPCAIVVDLLRMGEVGVVLESVWMTRNTNYVRVLSPRGVPGWTATGNVEAIDETG